MKEGAEDLEFKSKIKKLFLEKVDKHFSFNRSSPKLSIYVELIILKLLQIKH